MYNGAIVVPRIRRVKPARARNKGSVKIGAGERGRPHDNRRPICVNAVIFDGVRPCSLAETAFQAPLLGIKFVVVAARRRRAVKRLTSRFFFQRTELQACFSRPRKAFSIHHSTPFPSHDRGATPLRDHPRNITVRPVDPAHRRPCAFRNRAIAALSMLVHLPAHAAAERPVLAMISQRNHWRRSCRRTAAPPNPPPRK